MLLNPAYMMKTDGQGYVPYTINLPITTSATVTTIGRIIAVVAFEAGGRGKVVGVAITASCFFVVNTDHFTASAGMRQVEAGIPPGAGVMALAACHPGK
jgi:hypothetical protein